MSLTKDQIELIDQIEHDVEMRPIFLRTIVGLKWFDELANRGFFSPLENPKPELTTENRVVVPYWEVLDYLDKTASELDADKNQEYSREQILKFAYRYLGILRDVTYAAKLEDTSNYRTWSRFSGILCQLPVELITEDDLHMVEYWMSDSLDNYMVYENIGRKWLPTLLDTKTAHSYGLAEKLFPLIITIKEIDKEKSIANNGFERIKNTKFRMDIYQARRIVQENVERLGSKVGLMVLDSVTALIRSIIGESNTNKALVLHRPAIEDSEQNRVNDSVIDILIDLFRDALIAFVRTDPENGATFARTRLGMDCALVKRILIHVVSENYTLCGELYNEIISISQEFWNEQYKHEIWTLLQKNYALLSPDAKSNTLDRIDALYTDDEDMTDEVRAYYQSEWYAAIRDFGIKENDLYHDRIEKAGVEPEHPSFGVYGEARIIEPKSPKSIDEIIAMSILDLTSFLNDFEPDTSNFFENQLEGLLNVLQDSIRTDPLKFSRGLKNFAVIDLCFIYHVLEGFRKAWVDEPKQPWVGVWASLLGFCEKLVSKDEFWEDGNVSKFGSGPMIPNRHWIVGSIASLIEEGVRTDEHSFDEQFLSSAKRIVVILLSRQEEEPYNASMNAITNAINSSRGKCIKALINLTLRNCRIADRNSLKGGQNSHSIVWREYQGLFDGELDREIPSYEAYTLLARYLPNLLYISTKWTIENLHRVFPKGTPKMWRCAFEGFAYTSNTNREVYDFLKSNGHFTLVLDDESVDSEVKSKVIALACATFLQGLEDVDSDESFLKEILNRENNGEMKELIRQFWIVINNDESHTDRVIVFMGEVLNKISLQDQDGQSVASDLCLLVECIDSIDSKVLGYLLKIVPYAEVESNGYHVLEWLAKVSKTQTEQSFEVWKSLLSREISIYPEEAIRTILSNLLTDSYNGKKWSRDIVDIYLKANALRPHQILLELLDE